MTNWRSTVKMTSFFKNAFGNTLIVTGLAIGLGIGVAGAATDEASRPQAHSDGVGAVFTDTAITAEVKAKLMREDRLNESKISVTTTNGVVTLRGSASSTDAKSVAETTAKSVDGVKSIDNSLRTPGSSKTVAKTVRKTKRTVSDSWITTKVKSEILADSISKGLDVSVKTIHGVVALNGALPSQDAIDHVKDIAQKVKGVKSVDTSALTVAEK
jgi:hyperosmotically inducible protein